jgi:4-amino-4-deoxy-L-arabinose transferase-like glycosyltransferase
MKPYTIFFIATIALLGLLAILYALAPGVGVSPDSAVYLASAGSLLSGDGLSIPTGIDEPLPMTHFGPFYPILLAILGLSGMDLYHVAKWINVLLFPSIIFLVGLIVSRGNKNYFLLAPMACLPILFSEDILLIHSYAWSEPLFLFLCLLGLYLFARYLVQPTPLQLVLSVSLLSLAFLTRYAGVAVIPTIFLGMFIFHESNLPKKISRSLAISIACMVLPLIWFIRNLIVAGNVSDRALVYHPMTANDIRNLLETVSNWVLPGRITGTIRDVLAVAFLVASLILVLIGLYKYRERSNSQAKLTLDYVVPSIFLIFSFSYIFVLLLTILFFDAQAGLNYRLLSPILVSGLVIIFSILPVYLKRISWPIQLALSLTFLLVIAFNAVHTYKFIVRSHSGSLKMYAGNGWQDATIIHRVRALPDGLPIYSNGEDAIYFVTGKPAASFPQKSDPFSSLENPNYKDELDQMREVLEDRGGFIVCFTGMTWRVYLPDCEELETLLPLKVQWAGDDGWIYTLEPK